MKNKKSVKIDAMELQTVDGKEVTIERTEGEPEVGDKATPDGTHKMEGGQTIVVKKGVISEIFETDPNAIGLSRAKAMINLQRVKEGKSVIDWNKKQPGKDDKNKVDVAAAKEINAKRTADEKRHY